MTALFSLGNMANHAALVAEMRQLQIEQQIAGMLQSSAGDIVKNAQRLHNKLRAMGGAAPSNGQAAELSPLGPPGSEGITQGMQRMAMATPTSAAR